MASLNFYGVAVVNDDEQILRVFNGRDYVSDINSIKLFSQNQVIDARKEAGNQQRLNEDNEVRVIKIPVTINLELAPIADNPEAINNIASDEEEEEEEEEEAA